MFCGILSPQCLLVCMHIYPHLCSRVDRSTGTVGKAVLWAHYSIWWMDFRLGARGGSDGFRLRMFLPKEQVGLQDAASQSSEHFPQVAYDCLQLGKHCSSWYTRWLADRALEQYLESIILDGLCLCMSVPGCLCMLCIISFTFPFLVSVAFHFSDFVNPYSVCWKDKMSSQFGWSDTKGAIFCVV